MIIPSTSTRTTAQIFIELNDHFQTQYPLLQAQCENIPGEQVSIDARYTELQYSQAPPPQEEVLAKELGVFITTLRRLQEGQKATHAIAQELKNGIDHLKSPHLEVLTLDTIKKEDPDVYTRVIENHRTCMKHFQQLKEHYSKMRTLSMTMDANIYSFKTSISYFDLIVKNKGMPLGYYQLWNLQFRGGQNLIDEVIAVNDDLTEEKLSPVNRDQEDEPIFVDHEGSPASPINGDVLVIEDDATSINDDLKAQSPHETCPQNAVAASSDAASNTQVISSRRARKLRANEKARIDRMAKQKEKQEIKQARTELSKKQEQLAHLLGVLETLKR